MKAPVIRPAVPADVSTLFAFSQALSEFEQLAHEMVGTEEDLHRALFGPRPFAEALLAELEGQVVGSATYFYNFSTFLMKPGLYLEDLYVVPDFRRRGVATALLKALAGQAIAQGCGRLEWSVLDWNTDAIRFYKGIGAVLMDDWTGCRVSGQALSVLAASTVD